MALIALSEITGWLAWMHITDYMPLGGLEWLVIAAWTTPRTWVAAEVLTAALMNTHVRDNENELRAGGIAIGSQATGDFLFASSSTQFGRLAAVANKVPRWNSAGTAWEMTGIAPNVLTKTAAYSVVDADGEWVVILANATTAAFSVTLPAASGRSGRVVEVKKTDSTANAVTIDPNAAETLDGSATQAISVQYTALTCVCDGSNWHIV